MRYIVLDTNCLIACIGFSSAYRLVWDFFINNKFVLCISNEILTEYEEVLAKKTSKEVANNIIETIVNRKNTIFINPAYRFNLIAADPDDNKFVDCAIIADADYIVSNDSHFDILKNIDFPKVNVISIKDFVKYLELSDSKY